MKVLVTGAAGYVGQLLCPLLDAAGHTVRALDLVQAPGVESFDVVSEDFPLEGIDAVVPLASYVGPKCEQAPALAKVVNETAAIRLAKQLDGRRCVCLTTDSGYPPGDAVAEDAPFEPRSVYARTKAAGTEALRDVGATVFRLGSLFGVSPCMRDDLLLHFLTRYAVTHARMPVIRGATGRGLTRRSFVHIRDVCQSVLVALEHTGSVGQTYNLVSPDRLTKVGVAHTVQLVADVPPEVCVEPDDDMDGRDFWLDGSKWGVCPTRIAAALPVLCDYYRRRM